MVMTSRTPHCWKVLGLADQKHDRKSCALSLSERLGDRKRTRIERNATHASPFRRLRSSWAKESKPPRYRNWQPSGDREGVEYLPRTRQENQIVGVIELWVRNPSSESGRPVRRTQSRTMTKRKGAKVSHCKTPAIVLKDLRTHPGPSRQRPSVWSSCLYVNSMVKSLAFI